MDGLKIVKQPMQSMKNRFFVLQKKLKVNGNTFISNI